ncbi:alkaline phosphatase PhoX [Croceicoccus bisphenolivorans]|uniref:alkaline phosphatase PhoX n=1 Tax=Croceicoccus bisphenolivorans TaxID=1783232 RepID=UPI0008368C14|nr:alkaline phosphatase PhoX [Croceicoccus bisphenolivorans]
MTFQNDASRRLFLKSTAGAFAALVASGCTARSLTASAPSASPLGPLVPDPAGILDLPQGASYRVISQLGDMMHDGLTVPDNADGMGCFALPDGGIALVRNHELKVDGKPGGNLANGFDRAPDGSVLPGGTTTLVLDPETLAVTRQHRSLAGTIRNCAGGITPWGSWLTCEEDVTRPGPDASDDHGWVFEVPAAATGMVDAVPLKAMGRFKHEAAAVDPRTGVVYLTEDRDESAFYRFIPNRPGDLAAGGRLQAAVLTGTAADTRNWTGVSMEPSSWSGVRWIDLDNPEAPEDDLRFRAAAQGGAIFARGEGIHMGDGEVYFCCTSGGAAKLGQIFRLVPGVDGAQDRMQLFFESESKDQFDYGDNLTVAPNGHLVVCEDQYTDVVDNHLRGITPDGQAYPLGRLRLQTELAGACFSPDGKTLFVNAYSPAMTLAITLPGGWGA